MVVFTVARVNLKVFQRGGMKQHKHVFVFRSLLLNRLEPQSSKVKILLPIMPIGIVAYAFTIFVGKPLSKKLYIINRTIHGRLEIWNLSSRVHIRHLTRSLRSLVRYRCEHSKINSISPRDHVLFSI